jgi:ribosomal protein S18 acetylase RimI-like enzyme
VANLAYIETGGQGIDLIRPLWEKLKEHHRKHSKYFSHIYSDAGGFTFEKRKEALLEKSKFGMLRIDIVIDVDTGGYIGYCISTISKDMEGEIDSIFIDDKYRSSGIGSSLMDRAIEWMDSYKVKSKKISVAAGNEDVLPFYIKHGFYSRYIILEHKKIDKRL